MISCFMVSDWWSSSVSLKRLRYTKGSKCFQTGAGVPSKGIFPLAERMQNDYDGDRFWATWDPSSVDSYENTPSPPSLPSPESFGIEVDE